MMMEHVVVWLLPFVVAALESLAERRAQNTAIVGNSNPITEFWVFWGELSHDFSCGSHTDPTKDAEHDLNRQIFRAWVGCEANKRILHNSTRVEFSVTCQLRPRMWRTSKWGQKTMISPCWPQNATMMSTSFHIPHCNANRMRNNIGTLPVSHKLMWTWTIWPMKSGLLGTFGTMGIQEVQTTCFSPTVGATS